MAKTRQHICAERPQLRRYHQAAEGVQVSQEDIQKFLAAYEGLDRAEGTIQFYQRRLRRFYQDLPEDKTIRHDTMKNWQEKLLQDGYAPGSVNAFLSAANSYLDYIGHREYQLAGQLEPGNSPQPELSRTEYLRLLQTARALGKEKVYLLVKLFGSTSLTVQELPKVTAETVEAGKVTVVFSGVKSVVHIPEHLQKELLDYTRKNGILSGPVFCTKSGMPVNRTYVSAAIRNLCVNAGVPEEKGNPRCLKRLYQATRGVIESNISLLVDQAMERILEREQLEIGWEEG